MVKTINVNDLRLLLETGKVTLVDVREIAEYQSAHIRNAVLIPLSEFSLKSLPTQTHPIVIQCASGKRSEIACIRLLIEAPDLNVYNLEGGINAWMQAGLPVLNS